MMAWGLAWQFGVSIDIMVGNLVAVVCRISFCMHMD